jgi:hypothetical protein
MASTNPTTVVQTVACDLGNCGSCRGQVVTLTLGLDAPIVPCAHICHLPEAWAEAVAVHPPCDDDQELEEILTWKATGCWRTNTSGCGRCDPAPAPSPVADRHGQPASEAGPGH